MINVDQRTFQAEVLDSAGIVFVYFWAPWCGLCRLIEPCLQQLAQGDPACKLVGINADQNLKLVAQYRLTTLPTLLVFEQGQLQTQLENFHDLDQLQKGLSQALTLSAKYRWQTSLRAIAS